MTVACHRPHIMVHVLTLKRCAHAQYLQGCCAHRPGPSSPWRPQYRATAIMEDRGKVSGSSELLQREQGSSSELLKARSSVDSLKPPQPQGANPNHEDFLQMHKLEGGAISAITETEYSNFLRNPSISYLVLTGIQAALGVFILAMGGAAFAITPTYRAGSFWAGLMVRCEM